jgi:hypothetical protein
LAVEEVQQFHKIALNEYGEGGNVAAVRKSWIPGFPGHDENTKKDGLLRKGSQ